MQQPADGEHDRPGQRGAGDRTRIRTKKGEDAKPRHQIISDVHAEHHEVAMCEIHHAHDAEDDTEADAHQAVSAADEQPGGEGLEEIDDVPPQGFHAHLPAKSAYCCRRGYPRGIPWLPEITIGTWRPGRWNGRDMAVAAC